MSPQLSGAGPVICSFFLLGAACGVLAQAKLETPAPLDPVLAQREARELVRAMLAQQPEENMTNTGRLIIQPSRAARTEMRVRFVTLRTRSNWSTIYETLPGNGATRPTRLTVVHNPGRPNQYLLSEPGPSGTAARELSGAELMVPFAGSDFWVADLGFEFLFWPKQTLLKKEMKNNRFCDVLESTNPKPQGEGYARVVSWITAEPPHGPAHAEAYDSSGKKIKVFDPKSIEKVEGVYQLHSVEMRDLKKHSRTVMEFNSDTD